MATSSWWSNVARKLRSKDLQRLADEAAIASAVGFAVQWYTGRIHTGPIYSRNELWERADFTTADYGSPEWALAGARFAVAERGADQYGRRGIIYAIAQNGHTIHVE